MEGPLALSAAIPQSGSGDSLDPEAVVEYLTDVLYATLGASRDELQSYGSLLSPELLSDTLQKCARFSQQSQTGLYVHQVLSITAAAKQVNGVNGVSGIYAENDLSRFLYTNCRKTQ